MVLDEQQIEQVKALFDQWLLENNADIEVAFSRASIWADRMRSDHLAIDTKIKEFQQSIEKLQKFYDKFNGEK